MDIKRDSILWIFWKELLWDPANMGLKSLGGVAGISSTCEGCTECSYHACCLTRVVYIHLSTGYSIGRCPIILRFL